MPAFSFKERFVPFVKDGSKPGTIRNFRKHPIRVGTPAHLFFGMRTKFCTKLVEPSPVINQSVCIFISAKRDIALIDINWIEPHMREKIRLMTKRELDVLFGKDIRWLTSGGADLFAWRDGFRHSDRPEEKEGCCDLMLRYWSVNTDLPYLGTWTLWGDKTITI